jgi:hypothetical protein
MRSRRAAIRQNYETSTAAHIETTVLCAVISFSAVDRSGQKSGISQGMPGSLSPAGTHLSVGPGPAGGSVPAGPSPICSVAKTAVRV